MAVSTSKSDPDFPMRETDNSGLKIYNNANLMHLIFAYVYSTKICAENEWYELIFAQIHLGIITEIPVEIVELLCHNRDYRVIKAFHKLVPLRLVGMPWPWESIPMCLTAKDGNLEMIQWFYKNYPDELRPDVIEAATGYPEILLWLKKNTGIICDKNAYEKVVWSAIRNGNLTSLKLLKTWGFPFIDTLDRAAKCGRLDIFIWLYENGIGLPIDPREATNIIDTAARGGFLNLLIWLHGHSFQCSYRAIEDASCFGHLPIVQFLCSVGERFTWQALIGATREGHLEIVKYLYDHINLYDRSIDKQWVIGEKKRLIKEATEISMNSAISNGNFNLIKKLCDYGDCDFDFKVLLSYAKSLRSNTGIIEFLDLKMRRQRASRNLPGPRLIKF